MCCNVNSKAEPSQKMQAPIVLRRTTVVPASLKKDSNYPARNERGAAAQKPRVFGDCAFDYLKSCKHRFGSSSSAGASRALPCPYCILANQETKAFFAKEEEQRAKARQQSMSNRSILRSGLLHQWACSQSIHYYTPTLNALSKDADGVFAYDCALDVMWSRALLRCFLEHSLDTPLDLEEMLKVMRRRNRVFKVGHFAALVIQRQVRRLLTTLRVRRYLLQRFEYLPATKTRKAAFYDRERLRRVDRYPLLLMRMPRYHSARHFVKGSLGLENVLEGRSLAGTVTYGETPGTPRTIARRLQYEEKQAQERLRGFVKSLERLSEIGVFVRRVHLSSAAHGEDDVSVLTGNSSQKQYVENFDDIDAAMQRLEQQHVRHLKQLSILRDLVHITICRLSLAVRQQQQQLLLQQQQQQHQQQQQNSSAKQRASVSANGNAFLASTFSLSADALLPVWILPSAPCMAARELGLSIVLLTTPSPSLSSASIDSVPAGPKGVLERTSSVSSVQSTASRATKNSDISLPLARSRSGAVGAKTAIAPAPISSLHRSLQLLEQHALEALRCRSADEVVRKLFHKDLLPIYESIENITQDECGIWNPAVYRLSGFSTNPTNDSALEPSLQSIQQRTSLPPSSNTSITTKPQEDLEDASSLGSMTSQDMLSLEEQQDSFQVLPFGVQLRPVYAERYPGGLFRLFFFQQELVAVSAYSPWVYYPEVMKSRDFILNNIRKFSASASFKSFMAQAHRSVEGQRGKAPVNTNANVSSNLSTGSRKYSVVSTASTKQSSKGTARNTNSAPQSVLPSPSTLFAPSDEIVFPADEAATVESVALPDLTDQAVLALAEKYKFLRGIGVFQERRRRAQNNMGRRKTQVGKAANTSAITVTKPTTEAEKHKLLFEQLSTQLQGHEIYTSLNQLQAQFSSSSSAVAVSAVPDSYAQALWKQSCGVDVDIESRIIRPPDIVESNPAASTELFVVDVHVNLPKPKAPTGRRMSTVNGSDSGDGNIQATVEIHQTVGLFPCSQDKCPANLDCGLFDFDYFHKIYQERQKVSDSWGMAAEYTGSSTKSQSSLTSGGSGGTSSSGILHWGHPDPSSGVCVGRSVLASGRTFQMKILGNFPSKECLHDTLPNKVKAWLGITSIK